ncbi:MAG: LTA synthase family protein [Simkaniaceae bacterium]|nr:MAG: LTA synthase family protein [Simkaniaceae bacterium]
MIFAQAIPPLFARLIVRRNFSFLGILQDLFVGFQLAFLGPLAPLIQLLILYDALLYKELGYRLDWKAVSFLKDAKDFRDSAKAMGIWKVFPLFLIVAVVPVFFNAPSHWVLAGIPLWLSPKDSLVLLWEKDLFFCSKQKQKRNFLSFVQKEIIRPTEIYHSLSEDYPLYRHTKGFRGEKIAHIDGKGKPHVIFIFFESLRAKDLHYLPHLSALAKESLTFPNFYSNSILTFRTFFTSLYGLPYDLRESWGLDKELDIYGLPDLLKREGYTRNFFTGSGWSLGGIRSFLSKYGGDCIFDRKELIEHFGKIDQNSWGVADEYLFEFALDHLDKHREEPQFYSLLTISSHHPWNVPKSYQGPTFEEVELEMTRKYLQTLYYTDQCIGNFVKGLKERNLAKDTLLFITGDHGCYHGKKGSSSGLGYNRRAKSSKGIHPDNFHVPFMIYGEGRVEKGKEIMTWGSHADFLPTFLDLFNLDGRQHSIGKSLLRTDETAPVFYHNPSHGVCFKGASKETEETFQELMDSLFHSGTFAPKIARDHLRLDSFTPSLSLGRDALAKEIKAKSPMVSLNLNHHQATNDALLRSIPDWNPDLQYLSVSQSYRITDIGVKELVSRSPSLISLDLSNCPLLTSECLKKLPERFDALNISGTDIIFDKQLKDLQILKIKRTLFSAKELKNLSFLCPNLKTLYISYPKFNGEIIRNSIDSLFLNTLLIDECDQMSNEEAEKLFVPHLYPCCLILKRCYRLTDVLFQGLKKISIYHLRLQGAASLTDDGLISLLKLPLDALEIQGCPNLTDRGMAAVEKYRSKFSVLQIIM